MAPQGYGPWRAAVKVVADACQRLVGIGAVEILWTFGEKPVEPLTMIKKFALVRLETRESAPVHARFVGAFA
jgi:hypothetical protein